MDGVGRLRRIGDGRDLERRLELVGGVLAVDWSVPDVDPFDGGVTVTDAVAIEQLPGEAHRRGVEGASLPLERD